MNDEILCEIRATREAFAAAHGYDARAMGEAIRERARASGRVHVALPPRRPGEGVPAFSTVPAGNGGVVEDEIMREIRATREAFAAAHGYDVRAMLEALRAMPLPPGFEVVRLEPRPVTPVPAPSAPPTEAA